MAKDDLSEWKVKMERYLELQRQIEAAKSLVVKLKSEFDPLQKEMMAGGLKLPLDVCWDLMDRTVPCVSVFDWKSLKNLRVGDSHAKVVPICPHISIPSAYEVNPRDVVCKDKIPVTIHCDECEGDYSFLICIG